MIFYVCPVGGHTCGTSALFFFSGRWGRIQRTHSWKTIKLDLIQTHESCDADAPQHGGGISTLLERIRVKYKIIQLTGNQPSSFKSLPFLQRAVKWHAQVCEEISLCSQTIFFPPAGTTRHKKGQNRRKTFGISTTFLKTTV